MSRRLVDGVLPKPKKGSKAEKKMLRGRPSEIELTPEIMDKICAVLRIGAHVDIAGAVNGVPMSTLRLWIIKGTEDADSLYGAFLNRIHQTLAEFESRSLISLNQAANGTPAEYLMQPVKNGNGDPVMLRANEPLMEPVRDNEGNPILKKSEVRGDPRINQWLLERRSSKRWGRKDHIRVDMDDILNIQKESNPADRQVVSPEQYSAKVDELRLKLRALDALEDDEYSK